MEAVCVHACVRVRVWDFLFSDKAKSCAAVDSLHVLSPKQQLQLETEEVERDRRSRQPPSPVDVNTGISPQLKLLSVSIRAQLE